MDSGSSTRLYSNDSDIITLLILINSNIKKILQELSNSNILDKEIYIKITSSILEYINDILLNEYSFPINIKVLPPVSVSSLSEIFVLLIELEILFNDLLSKINLIPNIYKNNRKKYLQSIINPLSINVKELIERVKKNLPTGRVKKNFTIIGGRKYKNKKNKYNKIFSRKCRK